MSRKKANQLKYLKIFLIVLCIIIISLFIQSIDENNKVKYLENQIKADELEYQELITQRHYIEYLMENGDNHSCSQIQDYYTYSVKNMYTLTQKLEGYLNNADFVWEEYEYLRKTLINYQIEYWLLAKKIDNICDSDYETILYFFSQEKTCSDCNPQAVILNHLRLESKNKLLIFSLDATMDGTISLLVDKYNVTNDKVSIVIDDEVYNYKNIDELKKIICEKNDKILFCKDLN